MPIHYERDDRRRRIVEMPVGVVTVQDIIGVMNRQVEEGAWSYTVLADARATVKGPSAAELHALLLHIGTLTCQHGPRGRTALVVAGAAFADSAARFARLSEFTGLEVGVFSSIEDAEQWLSPPEEG
jgi:hypothetical protein